jgi:hypothetical protein
LSTPPSPSGFASLNPSLALLAAPASPLLEFFISTFRTPPFLLPIYLAADERYDVPWQVLAAINEVESNYGQDLSTSSAGAEGWMQFLPAEWFVFGVDANGAGVRDPANPADAVFAAARYLAAAGAARDLRGAIYAYNHSSSYVESVLLRAKLLAETPQSLISGLSAIVSGSVPVSGAGSTVATPVWSSARPASGASPRGATQSAPSGAAAPPPRAAATGVAAPSAPAVVGAEVAAAAGAPVRAVQQSEVTRIGQSAKLGRFVELRDAYGDTYTYGKLARVDSRFALAAPSATASAAQGHVSAPIEAPLRAGAWVPAGTLLGNLPGAGPGAHVALLLEVRPPGAEALDPRPLLEAWHLLAATEAHSATPTQPLFGPQAPEALVGEVLLMSERQLEVRLLTDPRFHAYPCGRRDIATGKVNRRVLATLDLLLASGLAPTVSALACPHGAASARTSGAEHRGGDAVTISALNGMPIAVHNGRSAPVSSALARLLALPGALRPHAIVAPMSLRGKAGTRVLKGAPDSIDVSFGIAPEGSGASPSRPAPKPPAASVGSKPGGGSGNAVPGSVAPAEAPLSTQQWRRLIARLAHLPEPQVPGTPTGAAVKDNSASPAPQANSTAPWLPLALAGEPHHVGPARGVGRPRGRPHESPAAADRLGVSKPFVAPLAPEPTASACREGTGDAVLEVAHNEAEPEPTTLESFMILRARLNQASGPIRATFYRSPAEEENWTEIGKGEGEGTVLTPFETNLATNGDYDLCVAIEKVAEAGSVQHVALLSDRLVANGEPVVELAKPQAGLRGNVALESQPIASPEASKYPPATYEYKPSGQHGNWRTIETVAVSRLGKQGKLGYKLQNEFDTATLATGHYDFRLVAVPEPGGKEFLSRPLRQVLVDNTPPRVTLTPISSPIGGDTRLTAQTNDTFGTNEEGPGVRSVTFERARAGSHAFVKIGTPVIVPSGKLRGAGGRITYIYSRVFHTEAVANGAYDFRATAVDRAGNPPVRSAPVVGVEVQNASFGPPVSSHVSGVAAPANNATILGTIGKGDDQETWAYGFTSAAPPRKPDGSELEYTALHNQLVLLRHTKAEGWEIADVLRGANGKAFPLLPADKVAAIEVAGAMTPSGEGWLWLSEVSTEKGAPLTRGVFHRPAGKGQPFALDSEATETVGRTLAEWKHGLSSQGQSLEVSLHLGEAGGHVYGMLTSPRQAETPVTVPGPHDGSETINVRGQLAYWLLEGEKWAAQTVTPLPTPAELPRSSPELAAGEHVSLQVADVEAPGRGWGALCVAPLFEKCAAGWGLILGHFEPDGSGASHWSFNPSGLSALDLTDGLEGRGASVFPHALKAEANAGAGGVWIGAEVRTPGSGSFNVVARYDGAQRGVTNSWCSPPAALEVGCEEELGNAAVPDAIFPEEKAAVALTNHAIHIFSHERWSSFPAPGYAGQQESAAEPTHQGGDAFTDVGEGWLGGTSALGHWSTESASGALTAWPVADRFTLTSIALPPASSIPAGGPGRINEPGALAVGLNGATLNYEPAAGWLPQPTPSRVRRVNLFGVAFAAPTSAFAVGQSGVILHWNGSAWAEDPESSALTQSQLNAIAFAPSGEGWAVGTNGTILHYHGGAWSVEETLPSQVNITSVTVAGDEVFAIAGENLITRAPGGGWHEVEGLPASARGALRLVAGLPDGGVVVAGHSLLLVREAPGECRSGAHEAGERAHCFEPASQPFEGFAVALAPFREAGGPLRAFVSVAPPAYGRTNLAGFPAGDGELMRETASGWEDFSQAQFAGRETGLDGALKSDPVLAVATDAAGEHGWAVGGYAGTVDAVKQGTTESLAVRSLGWQTASIWRYDTSGGAPPPALASSTPSLPNEPNTVSFAFFSSPVCFESCAATVGVQPDVNLSAAAGQIGALAAQPGGPAFAMSGGDVLIGEFGHGGPDLGHMPELLAPLGGLPMFSALGGRDLAGTGADASDAWAEAFSESPPPFGAGQAGAGIAPISSEAPAPNGDAYRYYAFDAYQNGGIVRVIVLDNSLGSLAASSTADEQPPSREREWLEAQLGQAEREEQAFAQHVPIIVIASQPLRPGIGASDGESVASLLARRGVAAVFTASPAQRDERHEVPENPRSGEGQIPEYEGASMSYQQPGNNGVLWYLASVNTQTGQVQVNGVPVINSLALKPLNGLHVARSSTLQFEAIARRPPGSLATLEEQSPPAPGYENYVAIPSPGCSECVSPSYAFTSSEPAVGDFVEPSGPGSPYPKLDAHGHPIASSASGLFCGFNSGTTIVSVSAGLLTYSLPVTVAPGGFGPPCGTVPNPNAVPEVIPNPNRFRSPIRGTAAPPPPPPNQLQGALPTNLAVPPPAPAPPAATPAPPPAAKPPAPKPPAPPRPPAPIEPGPVPLEPVNIAPAIVPTPTPPVEPIPPGASGYAQSPSAAERREKAEKHASQSAFVLRRLDARSTAISGSSEPTWYYWAVGLTTLLALILGARGVRPRPRPRPALLERDDRSE